MLVRRSRIAGRLTKEAGVVSKIPGKAVGALGSLAGGVGRLALEHPILTLMGIGGATGGYLGMKGGGSRGLTPEHMRARLYGREAPVVKPSFRPVNPLKAQARLAKQVGGWASRTTQPWG